MKQREKGFDNDFGVRAKLPAYDALHDVNMKQFFDNPSLQQHLWRTGQVSRSDLSHNCQNMLRFHYVEQY